MRAVVIERPHEAVFREVETPACGPGDVLVRSRLAGVCRTDLEVLEGELDRTDQSPPEDSGPDR